MHARQDLKALSKKIGKLPTLPGVAVKILQAMQRETPSIAENAQVISADAPLSAKVLKAVNSPFYGLSNKITSVHQAMVFLGLNAVKNLALSFSLLSGFAPKRKGAFDYVQFSKDAIVGAIGISTIARPLGFARGRRRRLVFRRSRRLGERLFRENGDILGLRSRRLWCLRLSRLRRAP